MTPSAQITNTAAETRLVEAAGADFAHHRFGRSAGVPWVLSQHFRSIVEWGIPNHAREAGRAGS